MIYMYKMSTFKGEPEANARANQAQFENIKNRTKDSYKYRTRIRKTRKWTDWHGEGQRHRRCITASGSESHQLLAA